MRRVTNSIVQLSPKYCLKLVSGNAQVWNRFRYFNVSSGFSFSWRCFLVRTHTFSSCVTVTCWHTTRRTQRRALTQMRWCNSLWQFPERVEGQALIEWACCSVCSECVCVTGDEEGQLSITVGLIGLRAQECWCGLDAEERVSFSFTLCVYVCVSWETRLPTHPQIVFLSFSI